VIEREAANFLSRWSRLKRSGGDTAPVTATAPAEPAGPLPDVATLQFSDDFSRFLHDEVEEGVKRLALKKLFHSPVFNVMDGLDTYIDDYGIPDPIDDVMLKGLAHAQGLIFDIEPTAKAETAGVEVATPPLAVTVVTTESPSVGEPSLALEGARA
jgi:hypothetical protein